MMTLCRSSPGQASFAGLYVDGQVFGVRFKPEALTQTHSNRTPVNAQVVWVSERELARYIPYSVQEIRKMRRAGILKGYPDLRPGGTRFTYNLIEVSSKIRNQRATASKSLLQFNPEAIRIRL